MNQFLPRKEIKFLRISLGFPFQTTFGRKPSSQLPLNWLKKGDQEGFFNPNRKGFLIRNLKKNG